MGRKPKCTVDINVNIRMYKKGGADIILDQKLI